MSISRPGDLAHSYSGPNHFPGELLQCTLLEATLEKHPESQLVQSMVVHPVLEISHFAYITSHLYSMSYPGFPFLSECKCNLGCYFKPLKVMKQDYLWNNFPLRISAHFTRSNRLCTLQFPSFKCCHVQGSTNCSVAFPANGTPFSLSFTLLLVEVLEELGVPTRTGAVCIFLLLSLFRIPA